MYLPDEDTYLLMDAIYNNIHECKSALEIGPGSGVVITMIGL